MNRSTATFIPYDLRPAKQIERRILLALLASAREGGLANSDARYVGMGGFKFYDFILMHKFFGLRKMVSLEYDPKLYDRCVFNRPYGFIEVIKASCGDFLRSDKYTGRSIFWLDYDCSLNDSVIDDIQLLGTKLRLGSFAFVTVAAGIPGDLKSKSEDQRIEDLSEQFGPYAFGLDREDVTNSNFSNATYKILLSAIKNAFSTRPDGSFYPVMRILYRDSVEMLTIGGYFCGQAEAKNVRANLRESLPFLLVDEAAPFEIRTFNLSGRERDLIDFASTTRRNSSEGNKLRKLGLKQTEIEAYRDLVQFMPRYFEAIS